MPQWSRRVFLERSLAMAASVRAATLSEETALAQGAPARYRVVPVGLARCRTYSDADVSGALRFGFDLIGGLGPLAKGKTVTVKVNLTGTNFSPFMDLPVGETYMTHYATAYHLAAQLFRAGARRVRFVESTPRRTPLEPTLAEANWDLKALAALGPVVYENTRNRGSFDSYAHFKVPAGQMFASFELNRAYADTDVVVSLAKLKQHGTTGVTLTMKNMFGITPSSLYSGKPGDESAITGRQAIHDPRGHGDLDLPGLKQGFKSEEAGVRVPFTTVDICAARPIHLAIIDGISAINRGESRYSAGPAMRVVRPGVMIVGTNVVAVDAVGTAVMGFDPHAARATGAFAKSRCENHLLLAEQRGLGPADLRRIDVRGLTIAEALHPYS